MSSYTDFLTSIPGKAGIPSSYAAVIPNDTEDNLPAGTIGLLSGSSVPAEIAVITAAGTAITLPVAAYGALSGRFRRVKVAGTTATGIVAAVL